MADPLTSAATSMVPSRSERSLFDYANAGDINRRYALSQQSVAAARQRLDDQIAVDKATRERERWDRDTVDYNERENFKQVRGELLESLAGLDPDADDFESQVSGFLAASPQVAMEDDAVQALLNVKQNRYTERVRLRQEDNRLKQQEEAANRRATQQVRMALASEGFDPTPFDTEDGNFDAIGAFRALAQGKDQKALAKARQDQVEATEKADADYFERDPEVLDLVKAGAITDAEGLLRNRFENSPVKLPEELLDTIFTDTEAAFVARAQKPITDKPLERNEDNRSRQPLLDAYANAARSVYSAARGVRTLQRRGASKAAPAEDSAVDKVNPYLESLRLRMQQKN